MANKSLIYGFIDALGAAQRALVNADKRQEVYALGGKSTALNLSASTAIKATAGRVCQVNVITAGSAPGAIHDCATTGTAAAANQVAVIPNTVGLYKIDFPCATGITYVLGTGQVVAVSYI